MGQGLRWGLALGLGAALSSGAAAQGANDCSSAQPIAGVGTFNVNTVGATTDGPAACGNIGSDVWFEWTAPASDVFQFSTCPGASFDTVVAAYSGTCGSLVPLGCNDDTCGLQSEVGFAANAGSAYLLRLGGFNGATGTATLGVTQGGTTGGCANPATGPDVIVGVIPSASNYGAVGGMSAYSLGTTSCNTGNAELNWIANTPEHPVIGQNIYRLENGRFEQVGMSWLKHGFAALQGTACCSCVSSGTGTRLGVGCSDPYGSGLNGSQSGLGPRSQVNAFTGDFSYPFLAQGQTGDSIYKRIQVATDDVLASLHPTAQYFGEAQYITPDDAAAGNGFNNVSWVNMSRSGTTANLNVSGATNREEAAIYAWQANEPSVTLVEVQVPGEGEFIAASNVIDNGDGTWQYEYAVFNNNSHFSGQSFALQIGTGVSVQDVGMSFPLYHSGEPYTNATWDVTVVPGSSITWSTDPFMMDQNANALRWGTTYSFWFTANAAPVSRAASIGLFRPGNPGPQNLALAGPMDTMGGGAFIQNYCTATPNSTGETSKIRASNADLVGRTMDIEAYDLPANSMGYFITSPTQDFVPNPGGGGGNLCVGGAIGRAAGGGPFNSGAAGSFATVIDLDNLPTPGGSTAVMAGESRYFQAWHRDQVLTIATSNFTDGARVIFP